MPVLSLQNEQNDFIPDELLSNLTSTICPQDRAQYNKTHKHPKVCQNNITVSVFHARYRRPQICCFCISFSCSKEPVQLMLLFGAGLWNTCTRCSMAPQRWPQKIPLLSRPANICDWSWQVDIFYSAILPTKTIYSTPNREYCTFYELFCCVNRDISFLCDALAAQRQRISLPPVPDRATISSEDGQKASQAQEKIPSITVPPVLRLIV